MYNTLYIGLIIFLAIIMVLVCKKYNILNNCSQNDIVNFSSQESYLDPQRMQLLNSEKINIDLIKGVNGTNLFNRFNLSGPNKPYLGWPAESALITESYKLSAKQIEQRKLKELGLLPYI